MTLRQLVLSLWSFRNKIKTIKEQQNLYYEDPIKQRLVRNNRTKTDVNQQLKFQDYYGIMCIVPSNKTRDAHHRPENPGFVTAVEQPENTGFVTMT